MPESEFRTLYSDLSELSALSVLDDYETLEDLLKQTFPYLSASHLKKAYSGYGAGRSLLKQKVRQGQLITLPPLIYNFGHINPKYDEVKERPSFLGEDEFFLILDKPADVHCHPLSYGEGDNCLSFLREVGKYEALNVNKLSYDRGLLHRLDYGTSGVLLLSKREDVFQELRNSWNICAKEKIYFALVAGEFGKDKEGEWRHFIEAFGVKGSKMRVVSSLHSSLHSHSNSKAQEGRLRVELVSYSSEKDQSLLKVYLYTGVRHQIRVQLSYLGHPIVGDVLYGYKSERGEGDIAKRIFLHAHHYSFKWRDKNYSYSSPVFW